MRGNIFGVVFDAASFLPNCWQQVCRFGVCFSIWLGLLPIDVIAVVVFVVVIAVVFFVVALVWAMTSTSTLRNLFLFKFWY